MRRDKRKTRPDSDFRFAEDGRLRFREKRPAGERVVLSVFLLLSLCFGGMMGLMVGLLVRESLASRSWLPAAVALVLGAGLCMFVLLACFFQSVIFGMSAVIDPVRRLFSARYGLFRVRRTLEETDYLSVRPLYNRGDWSCVLSLRRPGRRWAWTLYWHCHGGAKFAARISAEKLAKEIREGWPEAPIRFEGWDWPGETPKGNAPARTEVSVEADAERLLVRRGWPRGKDASAYGALAIVSVVLAGFGAGVTHQFAELGPDPRWTALAGVVVFATVAVVLLLPAFIFAQAEALPSFALVHAAGGWFARNFGIVPVWMPLKPGFSFRVKVHRDDGWWICRVLLKRAGGRVEWLVYESGRTATRAEAGQIARQLAARLAALPNVGAVETGARRKAGDGTAGNGD